MTSTEPWDRGTYKLPRISDNSAKQWEPLSLKQMLSIDVGRSLAKGMWSHTRYLGNDPRPFDVRVVIIEMPENLVKSM